MKNRDIEEKINLIYRSRDILKAVSDGDKTSFSDVVKKSGLCKSTAHKYLGKLVDMGLIEKKTTSKDQRIRYYDLVVSNKLGGGLDIITCPKCDMVLTKKDIVKEKSDSDKIHRMIYCKSCGLKFNLDLETIKEN